MAQEKEDFNLAITYLESALVLNDKDCGAFNNSPSDTPLGLANINPPG
jgi:hypothetical protein